MADTATRAWPPRPARLARKPPPAAQRVRIPPDEGELLERAHTKGASDGQSNIVDQWSFDTGNLPGYVTYLRGECLLALTAAERSAAERAEQRRSAADTARAELAAAADRVRRLRHEARDATHQVMRARRRMDRQAQLEAHHRARRLDGDAGTPVQDDLTEPDQIWTEHAYRIDRDGDNLDDLDTVPTTAGPDTGNRADARSDTDGRPGGDAEPHAEARRAAGDGDGAVNGAVRGYGRRTIPDIWEGPYTDRIPDTMVYGILLALILVELPIQWVIFDYFHGRTPTDLLLSTVFTVSVALVLVLGPHIAGRLFRSRYATGTSRMLTAVSLGLLAPYVLVLAVLGDLRRKVLLVQQSTADASGVLQKLPSRVEMLGLTPITISVMFAALLLITGGISFLLGLARDHPWQVAYRDAELGRRFLCDELDRTMPALRHAQRKARDGADDDLESQDRLTAEIGRLRAVYAAAELAYLDGVAEGLADPAASQAVATLAAALRSAHRTLP